MKIVLTFENEDTYDRMDVTIEGYYSHEFSNRIKQAIETTPISSHNYINKWRQIGMESEMKD